MKEAINQGGPSSKLASFLVVLNPTPVTLQTVEIQILSTARIGMPSVKAAMISICFSRRRMFMGPIHAVEDGPDATLEN